MEKTVNRARTLCLTDKLAIIEYPPQIRMLRFGRSYDSRYLVNPIERVAMPYMVFVAHDHPITESMWHNTNLLHVGFANAPIQTVSDQLFIPPLPNIFPDASVCVHLHGSTPYRPDGMTMSDYSRALIDRFWAAFSTPGLWNCVSWIADSSLHNFTNWSNKSADPNFDPTSIHWGGKFRLEDVLYRLANYENNIVKTARKNWNG